MSYEFLIFVFLLLVFCFFTMILIANIMLSFMKMAKHEGVTDIKVRDLVGIGRKPPKKSRKQTEEEKKSAERQRINELINYNLDVYDGTEKGQVEVK